MAKRTDIKKVLIIGSGPIVIGQAAEFDYAGTQACLALKEEGYEVVLVNSNPATIMTDTSIADKVYMEPLTLDYIAKILRYERSDAIVPGIGGQTGLNKAMQLEQKGILKECGVELLGTSSESIERAEDRELFKEMCQSIGEPVIPSEITYNMEEAKKAALDIGYPVVLRPAFTLGGTGGGFAENEKELEDIRSQRKDILEGAKREAESIIRGANRQVENTIRTIKESQAEKEATKEARKGLQDFIQALGETKRVQEKNREAYLDEKLRQVEAHKAREQARRLRRAPKEERTALESTSEEQKRLEQFRTSPLKAGEKVRIKDNGLVGEVSKVSTKAVTVIVGNIQTKLPFDRVEKITANEFRAAEKKAAPSRVPLQKIDVSIQNRKLNFQPELDVRGQRVGEALENVMRYADDALMLSVGQVRILHGKGTGALREEIQKYLRTVPGVVSVADEDIRFGGSGVTVVKFG